VQPFLPCKSNDYFLFWVCVISFRYPECNAHAPYFIFVCSLSGSTIFFRIVSQTARFSEEKFLNIKCVFCISVQRFFETLFSEEFSEIWLYMYIGLHIQYPLFLSDLNEIGILSTGFVKILKFRISWKSLQWKQSCSILTDGRTWLT